MFNRVVDADGNVVPLTRPRNDSDDEDGDDEPQDGAVLLLHYRGGDGQNEKRRVEYRDKR